MHLSKSEKKLREDMHLHKTQLCTVMGDCRHLRKGSCKFAHSLEELCPTPERLTTTKGHSWAQEEPLPDQEVLDLIERYAALSSPSQLPEWVRDLRAHRKEGPPRKRARREEEEEEWEEKAHELEEVGYADEESKEAEWEDWESQESEEEDDNPFVDCDKPSQKVAETELDERMALLILAMQAILGYTALTWPNPRSLTVGGMLL